MFTDVISQNVMLKPGGAPGSILSAVLQGNATGSLYLVLVLRMADGSVKVVTSDDVTMPQPAPPKAGG